MNMKISEVVESAVFTPDVSWVDHYLKNLVWERNVYDFADQLTGVFDKKNIEFDVVKGSKPTNTEYDDKISYSTGLFGAEVVGDTIVIKITPAAVAADHSQFLARLKQLIKHELIHLAQRSRSATKNIGSSKSGDDYYADPQEIAAITAEIEDQLLAIEPNTNTLIDMIKRSDSRLYQSDRFRLYALLAKENPTKFKPVFNRMLKTLMARLTDLHGPSNQTQRRPTGQE